MSEEELREHCKKQIERCSLLKDYKHQLEHQAVLDLLEENKQLKDRIDKAIDYLYCVGDVIRPDLQLELLEILKEVSE